MHIDNDVIVFNHMVVMQESLIRKILKGNQRLLDFIDAFTSIDFSYYSDINIYEIKIELEVKGKDWELTAKDWFRPTLNKNKKVVAVESVKNSEAIADQIDKVGSYSRLMEIFQILIDQLENL